ncbi:metalloprotease [Pantoea phage Phynn]|nr:metalloprotease [Pantoea phage Phynn]
MIKSPCLMVRALLYYTHRNGGCNMLTDRSDMSIIHWATTIMKQHGLSQWKFKINGRLTRALGVCNYNTQTIDLARRHAQEDSYENILDTLLHEIAHAIAGWGAAHGPEWQKVAVRIGAKPVREKARIADPNGDPNKPVYVIFYEYAPSKKKYMSVVDKRFYEDCMFGKRNIKTMYVSGRKETRGKLSVVKMTSFELQSFLS